VEQSQGGHAVNHIGDTNKMVSDTPRTDAAIGNSQDRSWMDGTLCRQLERELNAANERTKRLEEAGNELSKLLGFSVGNDEDVEWACSLRFQNLARCDRAISEWAKAKEAKP
jgi:hypothetical protein